MQQYVILGLGVFGSKLATTLNYYGAEVVAVDLKEECASRISDQVTKTYVGDFTDMEFLSGLGIEGFDAGFVCTGTHIEESLLGVMNLQELGIPAVIAKSKNDRFEMVLEKVGATRVVRPEREMAVKIARSLLYRYILDLKEIDEEYSVVEMTVPEKWQGKTLIELDLRKQFGINVLGIKENEKLSTAIDPNKPLESDNILLLIAKTNQIILYDLSLD